MLNTAALATCALGTLGALGLTASVLHPWWMPFGPGVWRGPREGTHVALTFDDGPHPEYTMRIAEILERHHAPATFFCIGARLEDQLALGRALHSAGHELANHTFSHGTGRDLFSVRRLTQDLARCQAVLQAVTGLSSRFYRPAVGIRNPVVHRAATAQGLTVVTWSLSARDGALPFSTRRARWLGRLARPGSILTLHDGAAQSKSGCELREQTVRQLPLLLQTLFERGLKPVTLSALLGSPQLQ